MNALVIGGPLDGKIVDSLDPPPIGYRLLEAPLWQGPKCIVGYAAAMIPETEPPPSNALDRLLKASCVRWV